MNNNSAVFRAEYMFWSTVEDMFVPPAQYPEEYPPHFVRFIDGIIQAYRDDPIFPMVRSWLTNEEAVDFKWMERQAQDVIALYKHEPIDNYLLERMRRNLIHALNPNRPRI